MNDPQMYLNQGALSGQQVAQARNQHDEARAKFHKDWFDRFMYTVPEDLRVSVRTMFDSSYKETRSSYHNR